MAWTKSPAAVEITPPSTTAHPFDVGNFKAVYFFFDIKTHMQYIGFNI